MPESGALEVNSKTHLHLAAGVNRAGDPAKVGGSGKSQTAGIRRLEVVKDVSELQGESGANALGEFYVLGERRVQIPPIQAPQISHAAATGVDPQNTSAEICQDRRRVSKYVDLTRITSCAYADAGAIDHNSGTCDSSVG